ncbi:MAG: tetratricopeptide repeat protein [Verrucomicrobiaceae bacterium]
MSKRRRHKSRHNRPQPQLELAEVEAVSSSPIEGQPLTENFAAPSSSRWLHVIFACVLMALCAGMYVWTVDFPMVFDDFTYLIDNPVFHDASSFGYLGHFTEFATRPAKLGSDPDYAVNFILRPVAYASFHLNYWFDGFHPRWFRVVNVIIHALNSLLIYALVLAVFGRSAARGNLTRQSVMFIASVSAGLFAVHPLAIESVTYIIQRFTSLVVFFSLLSLWLYFLSLSASTRLRLWLLRSVAVVALLLAMQTKENAFMVPLLAVLMDWLVRGTRLRQACAQALPLLLCMPLIPILVFLTAAAQHGGIKWDTAINIVNSRDEPLNHWDYIVTQITVVAHYFRMLVWPAGQNLDPEWPRHTSLWQGPVLVALGCLAALMGAAWWLFRRYRGDVRFAASFVFMLWFFITVSVSSGIVPLPDMMAEHRSYLPSIGIFVMLACLLDRWRCAGTMGGRWFSTQRLVPLAVLVAMTALSWATCARNEVWRTSESLWKDTVAKSPNKFRTWGNLGTAYSLKGNEVKAVDCYRKALEIEPRFQNGLLNLSNSLLRLNRPKESLDTTMELIRLDENAARKGPVAFTLGLGLAGVGRYDEAVSVFRKLLAATPDDPMVHKALGLVYYQTGLPHRALDHYHRAEKVQPNDPQLQHMIRVAKQELAGRLERR